MASIEYEGNIRKFYLYKVLTSLEITVPIYVLFLLANELSMTQVMILQSFNTALIFLLEIPSGLFADLYGRKRSLLLASLFLTTGFLVFGLSSAYWLFFIAITFWALAHSFRSGADQAFLYDSLQSMRRTKEYARYAGRSNAIEMLVLGISAIIGSLIASRVGNRPLFFLSATFFLASFLVAFSFKEPSFHKRIIRKRHLAALRSSVSFSFTHSVVRNAIIFFGVFGCFAYLLYFLIQPFFDHGSHAKIVVGIAVAGYFLFCALGSSLAERFIGRFDDRRLILWILFLGALAFLCFPFVSAWFALLLLFLNSFVVGIAGVLVNDRINHHTASSRRATVLSVLNLFQKALYALIAPIIGFLADIYSLGATFLLIGIILSLFLLYHLLLFAGKFTSVLRKSYK